MKTLESPLSLPATSNAPEEAIPEQPVWVPGADRECDDGFAVTENSETGRFDAKVAFELSGVALNGCSLLSQPSPQEASRSADHRLSRLLHALDGEAAVEFIFGGGGTMDFSWRINGWIRDAPSKSEALLKARSLHQNLLLVLASEPAFRFAAGNVEDQPLRELNSGYAVSFETERIRLVVPQTVPFGFSGALGVAAL